MSELSLQSEDGDRAKRSPSATLSPLLAPKKRMQWRRVFAPPRPYEHLILQKGFDLESPVKRVVAGIRRIPNKLRMDGKREFEVAVYFVDLINNRYIDMPLEMFCDVRKQCFVPFENYSQSESVESRKVKIDENYTVSFVNVYNGTGLRINQTTPQGIISIVCLESGVEKLLQLNLLLNNHIMEICDFLHCVQTCYNYIVKFAGEKLPQHLIGRHIRACDVVSEINWKFCRKKVKEVYEIEMENNDVCDNLAFDDHRFLVIFEELSYYYKQQIAEDITQDHLELQYFGEIL